MLRALITHHLQALVHSFNLLCRKPVATVMTVLVIASALALPALFLVLTANLGQLTTAWKSNGHVSLYLKQATTEAAQKSVLQQVRATQGVAQATLKSSVDGLAELVQQEGMHDIMRYLPDNPLPAVIEVVPALIIDSPVKLDLLSRQLQVLPQVDQVKLDMEWVTRLYAILGFMSRVAGALMLLLAVAVFLIIGTVLRLTVHERLEEIQVLKLIGASDAFILRPFLYTGIGYGIAGAVLAVVMVTLFILSLGVAANQLADAYQMNYQLLCLSTRQILLLISFAIILGWLGARLSVTRQLAAIEL
ncbi:MAG: permease-like cell division protein FtsX [Legionellales bacterium]